MDTQKKKTRKQSEEFCRVKATNKATFGVTITKTETTGSHLFVREVGLLPSQEEHISEGDISILTYIP